MAPGDGFDGPSVATQTKWIPPSISQTAEIAEARLGAFSNQRSAFSRVTRAGFTARLLEG